MAYEVRFLDVNGDGIGEDAEMVSETPIPIPDVGEVVTAPKSGFYEVTARLFSYSQSAGKQATFCVMLYCKPTDRER
ncbi:MAG TPA: hypothetical protein VMJ32_03910 [Pirellulales bacterium]|jgi:hypothetical protein|nr:hypothetical protein [Pirellulales bacterium]